MPIGKADKVAVEIARGDIDLEDVRFKTPIGTEFTLNTEGVTPTITLIGARQRDGYEVLAYYE